MIWLFLPLQNRRKQVRNDKKYSLTVKLVPYRIRDRNSKILLVSPVSGTGQALFQGEAPSSFVKRIKEIWTHTALDSPKPVLSFSLD